MTGNDPRFTWGLVIDVLDVLERHGFRRGDDQHTGRAAGLIRDLALIYSGEREQPIGTTVAQVPPPAGTVTLVPPQLATVLKALGDAIAHRQPDLARLCEHCEAHPASLCDGCAADIDAVEAYRAVERQFIDQAGATGVGGQCGCEHHGGARCCICLPCVELAGVA